MIRITNTPLRGFEHFSREQSQMQFEYIYFISSLKDTYQSNVLLLEKQKERKKLTEC